jgi:hypothetical protein
MAEATKLSWTETRSAGKKVVKLAVQRGHYGLPDEDGKSDLWPWRELAEKPYGAEPTTEELALLGVTQEQLRDVVVPGSDDPVEVEHVVQVATYCFHHKVHTSGSPRDATDEDLRRVGYVPAASLVGPLAVLREAVELLYDPGRRTPANVAHLINTARSVLAALPTPERA